MSTFNETRKKWFNLAVKSLSALLRAITLNHNGDVYCLNCCHSYSIKKRLEKHEGACNDHDNCDVEMPNEDNKMLEYKHGEKSLKAPFMVPADLESLLEKYTHVKIILKSLIQRKKLSILFQVTHGLHVVHLMYQKTK